MSRNDDVAWSFVGLGAGLVLFYRGFRDLQLKRFIDGLATSKARSMAMGTVELSGTAELLQPMSDPILGEPCAYYSIVVREKRGSGKRSRWVTIHREDSAQHPFLVSDETGKIPVFPAKATPYLAQDLEGETGASDERVARYINGFPGWGGLRRVTASFLRPGDPVYVAGYAVPAEEPFTWAENALRGARLSLQHLARRLKGDAERMSALDTNKDGHVDSAEWDAGLARFKEELERAEPAREGSAAAIVRASPEGFLLIADKSEQALVAELGQAAVWKIFGGPALTIGCSLYLFFKFFP